ncbi:MAG: NUDIX domain-containing protein [Verrucomicrobiia bacterium]
MMQEELFDVVNENDEWIGRLPRSKVHKLGLRHRAVHVLVYNSRGELFLQKRSMLKDCFPGAWDSSASGHLAPGEDYDQCAVRETQEELGLTLREPPERLFKIAACAETGHEFVWVYRCVAEGPFQLDAQEIECGGWFSRERIAEWTSIKPGEFASGFLLIWRRLQLPAEG